MFFHFMECFCRQLISSYYQRILCHHFFYGEHQKIFFFFQPTTDIPICHKPLQLKLSIHNRYRTKPHFSHHKKRILNRSSFFNYGIVTAMVHNHFNSHKQTFSQRSARMKYRKFIGSKILLFHKRHCQSIAKCQCRCR